MVKFYTKQNSILPQFVIPGIVNKEAVSRKGDLVRIDEIMKYGYKEALRRKYQQKGKKMKCRAKQKEFDFVIYDGTNREQVFQTFPGNELNANLLYAMSCGEYTNPVYIFKIGDSFFSTRNKTFDLFFEPVEEPVICNQSAQLTTSSSQSQTLTAEVFDRPDCPAWAKYAAMDIDGTVCYFEDASRKNHYTEFIRRPKRKKGELPKGIPLPDWVEVGAYAYFDSKYHTITSIQTEGVSTPVVYFDTGEHLPWGSVRFDEVKEARVVPWTGDLSFCVGKVFKYGDYTLLCVGCRDDIVCFVGNCVDVKNETTIAGCTFTAKQLLDDGFTFADGKPCGEFEHLEYDPIDECFDWVN